MFITSLLGNTQKLDGGAMFGNAPREMWKKWLHPDDQNRIKLQCRCFLIEWENRKILLETGIGHFFPPHLQERYGVEESHHCLIDNLKKHSLEAEAITDVILSHLHFDHAGGLLRRLENNQLELAFPKATFYVSKQHWERAINPHPRDKASFIPELHQLLIASQKLILIGPHQPSPESSSAFQEPTLPPFFSFYLSQGHTPGLLHTLIKGNIQSFFFASDLIPGATWVHAPITMGYDRFPELLIEEKLKYLDLINQQNISLLFTHDPSIATSRVISTKGKWGPTEELTTLQRLPF
jgi:glyoxylase-like metal-dependent hydrolase (beta-lactamase superfamily II)